MAARTARNARNKLPAARNKLRAERASSGEKRAIHEPATCCFSPPFLSTPPHTHARFALRYSRLLLLCSNYDSTVCDVSFFESLYYFVTVCVKICLGLGMHGGGSAHSPSVVAVEREIGRLFRGGFWRASETKKTEEEMNYVEMRYKLEGREHPRDVAFKEVRAATHTHLWPRTWKAM